jgi:hypothetical protein
MLKVISEKNIDEYPMVSVIDYYKYPEIKIDS